MLRIQVYAYRADTSKRQNENQKRRYKRSLWQAPNFRGKLTPKMFGWRPPPFLLPGDPKEMQQSNRECPVHTIFVQSGSGWHVHVWQDVRGRPARQQPVKQWENEPQWGECWVPNQKEWTFVL